eukprot:3306932-Pleurochrysis_carterae.AAC.1
MHDTYTSLVMEGFVALFHSSLFIRPALRTHHSSLTLFKNRKKMVKAEEDGTQYYTGLTSITLGESLCMDWGLGDQHPQDPRFFRANWL